MKAQIQFYENIPTIDIHALLIKSAAELVSEDTPEYSKVAANLLNYKLRKDVYGGFKPNHLSSVIQDNLDRGLYDPAIKELYAADEIAELNDYIDHDRDLTIDYLGLEQFAGKYLVQNRVSGEVYETPQIAYMLISMILMSGEARETRLEKVKEFYDAVSKFYISLPTPIMGGVRTETRQYSSCVLVDTADSLDSINTTASTITKYISKKAGIGVNIGGIRAEGTSINNGAAVHTGLIPFMKYFQAAVKSCSQGAIRGGAATAFYPIWHKEFPNLIVAKNNKGTEETRVRHMDYSVQVSKLFYQRLIKGENISLFSPDAVPDMYESFFRDQDEFEKIYTAAEADDSIPRETMKASELFAMIIQERKDTGRIYIMNVDHCNTHGSFTSEYPIRQSNLCKEITFTYSTWRIFKRP